MGGVYSLARLGHIDRIIIIGLTGLSNQPYSSRGSPSSPFCNPIAHTGLAHGILRCIVLIFPSIYFGIKKSGITPGGKPSRGHNFKPIDSEEILICRCWKKLPVYRTPRKAVTERWAPRKLVFPAQSPGPPSSFPPSPCTFR